MARTEYDWPWEMGGSRIPPLAAAVLMRELSEDERDRLIAESGGKVHDARVLFLCGRFLEPIP